ncbi:MAG: oligosaccharide flippase family protein [Anaerolineales bacterium]|nr:oligosaccharide flippase family protein [Anaerolineales bacterium]
MFELLEAYGLLGIQHVSSLVMGFIRTKLIASSLGPFGLGIFSQANSFLLLLQGFTTLGLGGGFIKLVSEYHSRQDYERLNRTVSTALAAFSLFSLVLVAACILFQEPLARWAFADPQYGLFILIVAISGFLWAQYQTIAFLLRSLLLWLDFTIVSTAGYLLSILSVFILIRLAGLNGAVISLLVAQALNVLVAGFILRQRVLPKHPVRFWRHAPDRRAASELATFLAPSAAIQFLAYFATFAIRAEIVRQLGAEANGIYQTIWSISLVYMGLVATATSTYGIPKIASILNQPEKIVAVQNNGLRVSMLALFPLTLALYALREVWIPLLFSPAFISAGGFLLWQFLGDLFHAGRQNLNIILIPLIRLKYLVLDGVLYWGGWVALSVGLIPRLGVVAVPISYMIVNLALLLMAAAYSTLTAGFRLRKDNLLLLAKGAPLLALGYWAAGSLVDLGLRLLLCGGILLAMLAWLPARGEYQQAWAYLRKMTRRSEDSTTPDNPEP